MLFIPLLTLFVALAVLSGVLPHFTPVSKEACRAGLLLGLGGAEVSLCTRYNLPFSLLGLVLLGLGVHTAASRAWDAFDDRRMARRAEGHPAR